MALSWQQADGDRRLLSHLQSLARLLGGEAERNPPAFDEAYATSEGLLELVSLRRVEPAPARGED